MTGEPRSQASVSADRIRLRPERDGDGRFRYQLFCESRPQLALLPLDADGRERLTLLQFQAQTAGYRAQFPAARHDIIELDGEPVGRMLTDRSAGVVRLVDIAVAAHAQRRGVGGAALARLMDEAASAGASVRLQVSEGNPDALRFYLRLGFEPVVRNETHVEMEWPGTSPDRI